MDEKIKKLMEEELEQSIKDLSADEYGSEERTKRIDEITRLADAVSSAEKTEAEIETEKSKKKIEVAKVVTPIATGVCTLLMYGFLFKAGLKFEETGSFSSTTVRSLFTSLLRPKV